MHIRLDSRELESALHQRAHQLQGREVWVEVQLMMKKDEEDLRRERER
jgi:hypothetical protein